MRPGTQPGHLARPRVRASVLVGTGAVIERDARIEEQAAENAALRELVTALQSQVADVGGLFNRRYSAVKRIADPRAAARPGC